MKVASQVGVKKKDDDALNYQDYSTMGLLPGESPAEFEELRKNLIIEFAPDGPLEADHVSTLARLLWRKQNLSTFARAEWARERRSQIFEEEKSRRNVPELPEFPILHPFGISHDEAQAIARASAEAREAADEEARKELDDYFELTRGDLGTTGRLMAELEVEERLDAAIDQCLKRLRVLRSLKRNRY
jgi:hypothetical protein